MLNIEKNKEGSKFEIKLSGALDSATSADLEEVVKNELEGVEELTFDIADLQYVSSAGLRVFLSAQKTMNKQGNMVVKHVPDSIMDILEVTGFMEILTIEE